MVLVIMSLSDRLCRIVAKKYAIKYNELQKHEPLCHGTSTSAFRLMKKHGKIGGMELIDKDIDKIAQSKHHRDFKGESFWSPSIENCLRYANFTVKGNDKAVVLFLRNPDKYEWKAGHFTKSLFEDEDKKLSWKQKKDILLHDDGVIPTKELIGFFKLCGDIGATEFAKNLTNVGLSWASDEGKTWDSISLDDVDVFIATEEETNYIGDNFV